MKGDTADWIDLSLVPGLGPAGFRALLSRFGLPSEILSADAGDLAQIAGTKVAEAIKHRDRGASVDAALQWIDHPGHALVTLSDSTYPRALLEIPDPPPLIYVRGNPGWLSRPALAVVGSRNSTAQGRENAEQFARSLSEAGFTIISGLALGIDTAAHLGGLDGAGSTVAVVGTGADLIYPGRNQQLASRIVEQGALISEFPLGTPPVPGNFPRRNRLISGLSRGILVVEAALSSGSLITAKFAAEQGRDVLAIPGSIHSPLSRGCHALIKQGAKLVESAQDVLDEIRLDTSFRTAATDGIDPNISGPGAELLQYMGYDPCSVDSITNRSRLTPATVSAMLLALELEGVVTSLPGGMYQRVR